jgi:hypothetical protein
MDWRDKGVAGYPLPIILGLFVTALIIGALTGTYPETFDFYKEQMTVLQDERIESAALGMGSMAGGHLELDLQGNYQVKNTGGELYVKFGGTEDSTDLNSGAIGYYNVQGPSGSYVETDGQLCLTKDGRDIEIQVGTC